MRLDGSRIFITVCVLDCSSDPYSSMAMFCALCGGLLACDLLSMKFIVCAALRKSNQELEPSTL